MPIINPGIIQTTPSHWGEKFCRLCGRYLVASTKNFYRRVSNGSGLSSECIECEKKRREKRKENKRDLIINAF